MCQVMFSGSNKWGGKFVACLGVFCVKLVTEVTVAKWYNSSFSRYKALSYLMLMLFFFRR